MLSHPFNVTLSRLPRKLSAFLAVSFFSFATASLSSAEDQRVFFEKEIRPVLVDNCVKCHGPQKRQSGLRLDTASGVMQGGDSGPVVVPGDAASSLLIAAIRREGELRMPPNQGLDARQIAALTKWVKSGAFWPPEVATVSAAGTSIRSGPITDLERAFWSFQPVVRPRVPTPKDVDWSWSPVDDFVLSRLESLNLTPGKVAERRKLIRRASFDLTGLPPTPGEIAEFLADRRDDATVRLIDRLLDSPHYGERWGRHWLDVARYADTAGETADYPVPLAWRYRNYVIDAFNLDKPYDEFIREQIAGDIYAQSKPDRHAELVTATGFLAVSRRFGFGVADHLHLTIQDTIDTTGQAVLGLSLGCARCHDHKYDPISAADYYAWYGIFDSTRYSLSADEKTKAQRDLIPLIPFAEAERREKEAATQQRKSAYPVAYAVREGAPHDVLIHQRGNPDSLGEPVVRRQLEILGGALIQDPESSSGRLDLAEWLSSKDNPLAARVMVNRIWQHHFGRGIIETPNDFGARGSRPSHPELLDWLAAELMEHDWSIKHLHRVIMLSRTYQLSSVASDGLSPGDESLRTRNFGRYTQRRLDAESIRDAMLAASGRLDRTPGREHAFPPPDKWGYTQHSPFYAVYESDRRSVYVMRQRLKAHPFFSLFDAADPSATTGKRIETTTPTQALFLLNSPFVGENAAAFAARIRTSFEHDSKRLVWAYEVALGRQPDASELKAGIGFIQRYVSVVPDTTREQDSEAQAWTAFCRSLLVSNDFLFVE